MPKKRKPNIQRILIESFLKDPKAVWRDKGRKFEQIRIATDLGKLYSVEFWQGLHLPFKLNSLAWFKMPDGKKFLKVEYKKLFLNLESKEQPELGNRKVGRKKNFKKKKPKTLMEFLNDEEEEN